MFWRCYNFCWNLPNFPILFILFGNLVENFLKFFTVFPKRQVLRLLGKIEHILVLNIIALCWVILQIKIISHIVPIFTIYYLLYNCRIININHLFITIRINHIIGHFNLTIFHSVSVYQIFLLFYWLVLWRWIKKYLILKFVNWLFLKNRFIIFGNGFDINYCRLLARFFWLLLQQFHIISRWC